MLVNVVQAKRAEFFAPNITIKNRRLCRDRNNLRVLLFDRFFTEQTIEARIERSGRPRAPHHNKQRPSRVSLRAARSGRQAHTLP
jgi:hypothetical protein